jgi:SOS-response transcriptional repressor LexA
MPPHLAQGETRRSQIMVFLRHYWAENGFSPSMAEIGKAVGLRSQNSTRNHLLELKDQGFIAMTPGVARTITLVSPAPDGWSLGEEAGYAQLAKQRTGNAQERRAVARRRA